MIDYVIPLILLAGLVCLVNARLGLLISILAGFGMDPGRKVYPGQPVWMTGVVAAYVTATFVGIWLRGAGSSWIGVRDRYPRLVLPLGIGLLWVVIESARGYVLTGSLAVVAIGILAYVVPVLAFFVGFAVMDRVGDLERLTKLHIATTMVMLGASLLSAAGVRTELLDQVGDGMHIHAYGRTITARGGLFRGLEMAGWHAAAALSMVFVLGLADRKRPPLWILISGALVLGYGLLLSSRRKYIVQFVLFLALWGALGWLYRRSRQAAAWVALLVLIVGALVSTLEVGAARAERAKQDLSLRRLERLNDDTGSRIQYFAVTALADVYVRNGFFGSGAGTGSQGSQYFGAGMKRITGFQSEGGFGKVLAELGVPGLVLLAWFVFAAVRSALLAIAAASGRDPGSTDVATGVTAFLVSNLAVFAIAHQVFGDPFVLTMLGLLAGGLLRLPYAGVAAAAHVRNAESES